MTPDEMLAAMALMPKHTTVEFSWSMLLGGKSIVSCMITATYTEWRGRGDTHLLAFEQAFRAWEKASK